MKTRKATKTERMFGYYGAVVFPNFEILLGGIDHVYAWEAEGKIHVRRWKGVLGTAKMTLSVNGEVIDSHPARSEPDGRKYECDALDRRCDGCWPNV